MLDEQLETIGHEATEALLNTLKHDRGEDSRIKLPHQLVRKNSTAEPEGFAEAEKIDV